MGFADDVKRWSEKAVKRATDVRNAAAQDMVREVTKTVRQGGRLPIRTGNLRRSLLASTSAMPAMGGLGERYTGSTPGLVIAQARLSDTIWLGFQANYARRMNYGFIGQDSLGRTYHNQGFHFIEAAAKKWPEFVASRARRMGAG